MLAMVLTAMGWLLLELEVQAELLEPDELVDTLTASFNIYIYIYFTTFNNTHASQIYSYIILFVNLLFGRLPRRKTKVLLQTSSLKHHTSFQTA